MTRTLPDPEWELLRLIDPLSDELLAPVVERDHRQDLFLSIVESDRPRRRSRRRRPRGVILSASALASIIAAVVFAVLNLLPAASTPGAVGNAWAKRVIAHAITAAAGNRTGILHAVETVSGFDSGALTGQVWQTQAAPYQFWVVARLGSRTFITTIAGSRIEEYYCCSTYIPDGTIQEVNENDKHAPLAGPTWSFVDPEYQAAVALTHERGALPVYEPPTASRIKAPETFGDLIVRLLRTPGVKVALTHLNGRPAIRFSRTVHVKSETTTHYTLYVEPTTYRPVELVAVEASGNSSPPRTTITTFSKYQTLPTGSVKIPDLPKLYPRAHIVNAQNGRVIKR
jgi:hypothetical protein